MIGIKLVNLSMLIEEIGEEVAKSYLSSYSCPRNIDVEDFLRNKAIEFSKQGLSQTHLVMMPCNGQIVMVGYFTLANKFITVSVRRISRTLESRLRRFSIYDDKIDAYCLSAPLIAQLGKNFDNGYNKLISGDDLLAIASEKVRRIQFELGGRFAYVECENEPILIEFYKRNGFYEFDSRYIDKEETYGERLKLIQFLKYINK